MIYYGTDKAELIYFHLDEDKNNLYFIAMEQDCDENIFYVRSCCNPVWEWKFHYTVTNYEMVKYVIFDVGFDSEDIEEMMWMLDGYFEDVFDKIVVWDECECDCETSCEHCNCK